jgi:hypothetical protein
LTTRDAGETLEAPPPSGIQPVRGADPRKEAVMPVVVLDLVLAAWLLVSAFTLGHTVLSAALVGLGAVAVGAVAWLSRQRPGLRALNSALTFVLAALGLLLPSLSAAARINTAAVSLLLLAFSAVSPVHGAGHHVPHALGATTTPRPPPGGWD